MLRKMTKRDWWIVGGLTLAAGLLRFIGLEHPGVIVFDETYFAKFAHHYLTGTEFFDAEPPLAKFLIAGGEWLFGSDPNTLTAPFGWRFSTALVGTAVIPLFFLLTKRIFGGTWLPTVAGLLALFDGFLLVESRVTVLDGYVIFFNLLTYFLFLTSLQASTKRRGLAWLAAAGGSLGLGLSVKWITLAFFGPAVALLAILLLRRTKVVRGLLGAKDTWLSQLGIRAASLQHPATYLGLLVLLPAAIYYVLFALHVPFDSTHGSWWSIHQQIFNYHHNLQADHPYGSAWYTWPLQLRPIAYHFDSHNGFWQGIIALGNPVIWWGGALALLYLAFEYAKSRLRLLLALAAGGLVYVFPLVGIPVFLLLLLANWDFRRRDSLPVLLLVLAWGAHYLPWALIDRVLFVYHYAGSLPFAIIALALVLRRSWDWRPADASPQVGLWVGLVVAGGALGGLLGRSLVGGWGTVPSILLGSGLVSAALIWWTFTPWRGWRWGRKQAVAFVGLAALAFVYFLPIWVAIDLPVADYMRRMWLNSWI